MGEHFLDALSDQAGQRFGEEVVLEGQLLEAGELAELGRQRGQPILVPKNRTHRWG